MEEGEVIAAIDSYFMFVKTQMKKIDPLQQFGPVIPSRDWPQTPPKDSTLYLLYLNSIAMAPGTPTVMLYAHQCQWVWLIIGDDIQPDERAQNRGDRYRHSLAMQTNLRNANYPGFCPKKFYTANREGVVSSNGYTSYAVGGAESVWWPTPKFLPRFDAERSGLLYGIGAVDIYAYDDANPVIAPPYPN